MKSEMLGKIGLTKNESLIYITLLKIGSSKVGDIIKHSKINSGRIYETFESLKNKGLISESLINNIKHFTASPPEKILNYIDNKKKELDEEESLIKSEIETLNSLRNLKISETRALIYTGFEGIKTAAYETLNSIKKGEEILVMGATNLKDEKYNEFWLKHGIERAKGKHVTKFLFSNRGDYMAANKKRQFTECKVLEEITPTTIDIFGEEVVLILNYQEPESCILIYDKNTAISFKNFFYQLWALAKK